MSGYGFGPPDAAPRPAAPVVFQPAQPGATPTPPRTVGGKAVSGGAARWRVGAIAAAAVVLGVVALLLILQWSARADSAHGTFSNHTDMIGFSAASGQFDHLRDASLQG